MFRQFLILAAVPVLIAPAWAAKSCLDTWTVPDDRTLVVEDVHHHKFKVDLMGACTGLRFNEGLAFKAVGGTQLSCLSGGDYVLRRDQPSRCTISTVEPLGGTADQGNSDANMNVH